MENYTGHARYAQTIIEANPDRPVARGEFSLPLSLASAAGKIEDILRANGCPADITPNGGGTFTYILDHRYLTPYVESDDCSES